MDEYQSLSEKVRDYKYHVVCIPKCRRQALASGCIDFKRTKLRQPLLYIDFWIPVILLISGWFAGFRVLV
jgi:REP element-mobilizing transposase RayT